MLVLFQRTAAVAGWLMFAWSAFKIVNDWRSHIAGGIVTASLLWEVGCVPSLLHGVGTWVDISPEIDLRLNKIQQCIAMVLEVSSSGWTWCPPGLPSLGHSLPRHEAPGVD